MKIEDVALDDGLLNTFGCVEFEKAAMVLIRFLQSDETAKIPAWLGDNGSGWEKKFRITTLSEIDPWCFAALCSAGWVNHTWFPKGTFTVSDGFVRRLAARSRRKDNRYPIVEE